MTTAIESRAETLLTAEEFGKRADTGKPAELVRGRVVALNVPKPYHGWICGNVLDIVRDHVKAQDLGYVLCNDSGVITRRNPDSLRGADVAYYTYQKVPKGSLPLDRYLDVVPDLIFEVRSPDDRWPALLGKVAEYLEAGVSAVCVLDPATRKLDVYLADGPPRILGENDELSLPGILDDFRVVVGRFLE